MDRKITIEKGNPDGTLTLSDKDDTNGISGDQITWVIAPNSGVASITKIHEKDDSNNVFIGEPSLQPDGSWMGTLINVEVVTIEKYYINWTTAGGGWLGQDGKGLPMTYDPKITVNPK
ncbi:hypothetical protein [Lutibacter sp.]|uniref:hypothetical protein n=1 Tax=Lutibacter sp. TaxID=1925666 RepID=UPI0027328422|nr:hypothetical protein [Lutibacter sp.]MDP3313320.1 hypothetical protein [Lutibacter sp.]